MPGRLLQIQSVTVHAESAHVPCHRVQEAKAEAIELMGTHANLRTPKSGEILICANQDFLTSAFLLSNKSQFFTRPQFTQLCGFMDDACGQLDLPVHARAPVATALLRCTQAGTCLNVSCCWCCSNSAAGHLDLPA
jgi:hypothetical protein